MHDRGEKIVTLAREILRSDAAPVLPEPPQTHITMSFRTLCLATVLTAVSSSAVTTLVIETRRPLNHYEKTELDALIFYTAKQKSLSEDDIRHEVLEKLKISSFDTMTETDFVAARTYLQNEAN